MFLLVLFLLISGVYIVVLLKLVYQNLIKNKKQTIINILCILCTSTLIFSLAIIFSTLYNYEIDIIEMDNGSADVTYKNISYKDINIFSDVKKIYYYKCEDTIDDYKTHKVVYLYSINKEFFETVHITKGRLPQNENEIIVNNGSYDNDKDLYQIGESVVVNNKTYIIVGLNDKNYLPQASNSQAYKIGTFDSDDKVSVSISFNNPSVDKIMDYSRKLGGTCKIFSGNNVSCDNSGINMELLEMRGKARDNTSYSITLLLFSFVLTIITSFIIFSIRDTFYISFNHRRELYGTLYSIGMDRKQLYFMTLIEGIILIVISMLLATPLSILIAYFIVNKINNTILLPYLINLSYNKTFILITVALISFLILISLILIVRRVVKNNIMDSIKLKYKKVKYHERLSIISNIVLKSDKNNKNRFRLTKISIVLCLVLLITITSLINFSYESIMYGQEYKKYEAVITVNNSNDLDSYLNIITNKKYVKNYLVYQAFKVDGLIDGVSSQIDLISLDDNAYKQFQKKVKQNNDFIKVMGENTSNISLKLYDKKDNYKLDNIGYSNRNDYGFNGEYNPIIVTNRDNFVKILDLYKSTYGDKIYNSYLNNYYVYVDTKDYKSYDKYINNSSIINSVKYENYALEDTYGLQLLSMYKFFLYYIIGFICLICLINLINTIYSSILFKKQDLMLYKSIGMSHKDFMEIATKEYFLMTIGIFIFTAIIQSFNFYLIITFTSIDKTDNSLDFTIPWMIIIIIVLAMVFISYLALYIIINKILKDNIVEGIENHNF